MLKSEKNFLERMADAIPGLSGYRAREDRRTTDKRLREHLASRLDRVKDRVEAAKGARTDAHDLEGVGQLGRLTRSLQIAADGLRFASYGYSGAFDQAKIKEAELDILYTHDLKLAEAVGVLEDLVADPSHTVQEAAEAAAAVDRLLAERKSLWDRPDTGTP